MTESEAIQRFERHLCEPLSPLSIAICEKAIQALSEVKQYRAIGTIERFRELTEKAEPKKPIMIGYRKNG